MAPLQLAGQSGAEERPGMGELEFAFSAACLPLSDDGWPPPPLMPFAAAPVVVLAALLRCLRCAELSVAVVMASRWCVAEPRFEP